MKFQAENYDDLLLIFLMKRMGTFTTKEYSLELARFFCMQKDSASRLAQAIMYRYQDYLDKTTNSAKHYVYTCGHAFDVATGIEYEKGATLQNFLHLQYLLNVESVDYPVPEGIVGELFCLLSKMWHTIQQYKQDDPMFSPISIKLNHYHFSIINHNESCLMVCDGYKGALLGNSPWAIFSPVQDILLKEGFFWDPAILAASGDWESDRNRAMANLRSCRCIEALERIGHSDLELVKDFIARVDIKTCTASEVRGATTRFVSTASEEDALNLMLCLASYIKHRGSIV